MQCSALSSPQGMTNLSVARLLSAVSLCPNRIQLIDEDNRALHSAVQYSTVQCSAVQYSAVQYSECVEEEEEGLIRLGRNR